jgi:hypothetical protein
MVVCGKQALTPTAGETIFILPDFSGVRKIEQQK